MQRSLSAAKKGTPQAPKSCGQLGRRWQSVAGYTLSGLAPHDVHAKASHRCVMPRWVIHYLSGSVDLCSLQHVALWYLCRYLTEGCRLSLGPVSSRWHSTCLRYGKLRGWLLYIHKLLMSKSSELDCRILMCRDLSSGRAAPNPFDPDNGSSVSQHSSTSTGSQHLASTSATSNPPARCRPSRVINTGAAGTSFQHSTSAETRVQSNPFQANPLHQHNSSTKSAPLNTVISSHSASNFGAGSKEYSADNARTGGTTVPLSTSVSTVACHPVSPKRSSSSISIETDLVRASPVPLLGDKTGQPNPFAQL